MPDHVQVYGWDGGGLASPKFHNVPAALGRVASQFASLVADGLVWAGAVSCHFKNL